MADHWDYWETLQRRLRGIFGVWGSQGFFVYWFRCVLDLAIVWWKWRGDSVVLLCAESGLNFAGYGFLRFDFFGKICRQKFYFLFFWNLQILVFLGKVNVRKLSKRTTFWSFFKFRYFQFHFKINLFHKQNSKSALQFGPPWTQIPSLRAGSNSHNFLSILTLKNDSKTIQK